MADAGLPYVGSVMSLISHGEVRYEGILSHVDMPNSSITLSNVRCLGTEGRSVGGQQIPASDQVFQTVVFKGTEIKELTVLQPPPVEQPPYLPSSEPTAQLGSSAWGAPAAPQQPAAPANAFGANPWGAPPSSAPQAAAVPPPPPSSKPIPAPAPTVAVASVGQTGNGTSAPRTRPTSYAHAAGATAAGGRGPGGRGGAPRGRIGHGRGGRGGHHQHHHGRGGPIPMTIPTEEFNFEEALKRFDKEKVLEETMTTDTSVAKSHQRNHPSCVYKKDDFFDEISCEALEKLTMADGESVDRRGRMAAQRRTDVETFGTSSRGRGGTRGGRGVSRGRVPRGGRSNRGGPVAVQA